MIYKVKGRISAVESDNLAKDLNNILTSGEDIILDFSELNYISSAGLRVLIMFFKQFRAKGYDFSIVNANDEIKKIFVVTGLTDLFLIDDNYFNDKSR